ncbi:hypothetical protein J1N35_025541, partial [Gossypium stocksii]
MGCFVAFYNFLFSLWLSLPETGCLVKNLLVDGLSPCTVKQRSGLSSLGSPLKIVSEPVREVIPQVVSEDGKKVRCQHPLTESDMEELQIIEGGRSFPFLPQ